MEALPMVFKGWMRIKRSGPWYKVKENIYQMVNRARSPYFSLRAKL